MSKKVGIGILLCAIAVIAVVVLMWSVTSKTGTEGVGEYRAGKETVSSPSGAVKFVFGITSWPGHSPVYVGDELGFFKEAGINLEIRVMDAYDARRAALAAGEIHIDATTMDQVLIYSESGVDAQIFGFSDRSTGGDGIVAKKDILEVKSLKGRTVTFAEASPSEFFLRWILKENGLTINDVKTQPVADPQTAGSAILAEKVDAAVTFEPWLSQCADKETLHVLVTTEKYPDLIPGLFVARVGDLQKRPGAYRRFMEVWFKCVDYVKAYPEKASEIMSRRSDIPKDEFNAMLSSLEHLGRTENAKMFDMQQHPNVFDLLESIASFWSESGYIKKPVEARSLASGEYIKTQAKGE